ncbi:hypothetical protein [Clostridium gasigenes]|nr:hypothetical protein [Clostridium gasigenes]
MDVNVKGVIEQVYTKIYKEEIGTIYTLGFKRGLRSFAGAVR